MADRADLVVERDQRPDLGSATDRARQAEFGQQQKRLENTVGVHDRRGPQQRYAGAIPAPRVAAVSHSPHRSARRCLRAATTR
jgi:hypothetical protein